MNESTRLQCSPPALAADAAFGPIVDGCRDDFTFTFEQYFLCIVPSVLFLLLAPLRVHVLKKRQAKVGGSALRFVKLAAIGVLVVLQLTTVILWTTTSYGIRGTAAAASTLSFLSSLVLLGLSHLEHSRSLRPSVLLNAYLFFTVLFDAVVLRTLWIALPSSAVRDVFTASFALKTVILFLEAKEKREFIRHDRQVGPEETSGLYSQTVVWWINSIIKQGYRAVLRPTDLYPVDENMSSEVLNEKFWKEWNKVSQRVKPSLAKVVIRILRWPFFIPVLPRFALLGFTFCQPLLVSRLLEFLQDPREPVNTGYALVGAYAIVYFGKSVSNSLFLHQMYRSIAMVRGTLVSAIYTKTTEISITAVDNSAAVTLMSADVERLVLGLRGVHDIWANIIQFALATWLLETRMGWASVGPTIIILLTCALTVVLAFMANKMQLNWLNKIEKRIGITSNMLGHMKGIKMSGLTTKLTELIQSLRGDEIKSAEKFWFVGALAASLSFMPQMLSPVATFAFYAIIATRDGTTLDAPRLFSSLALLILLTQPLIAFCQDLLEFRAIAGCIGRIEAFLTKETRSDHRISTTIRSLRSSRSPEGPSNGSNDTARPDEIELIHTGLHGAIEDGHVSSDVIRIESGSFGWSKDGMSILQDISLTISRSQLTLLIGPVASGKSTLLKAILGETPSSKGFIYWSDVTAAYCEQTPWLMNASVKDNIIGFSHPNQSLYESIIHCCDLEQDIATFPNGHDTVIGSKGISLSTGQKQRIAIARAVFAKKDFVIFDDVFSGLDVNTQRNVFSRLLGPNGLFRQWGTTVFLATHAVNLLPYSDRVIALSARGTIAEQGTFEELNTRDGYVRRFCLEHANNGRLNAEKESNSSTTSSSGPLIPSQVDSLELSELDKRRQLGDWATYTYYFSTIGWGVMTTFFAIGCGWGFFASFPTVWLKWFVDANARAPNKHNGYYLGVYTAFQVIGVIDMCLLTYFSFNVMAKRACLRLHEITLKTVMSAPMSFFSKTDTGSTINRFSQDMQLLDTKLPFSIMAVTGGFLMCLGQMGLIASAAYYIAVAFPFLFVIYFFLQKYYLRTSRQMRFLDIEEKAPVYTQFLESLSGLATIRAFNWQKSSIAHNHILVDKSQKPYYLMFMIQTWLSLVLDLITTALAVLVTGVAVKMRDTISVGFTGVSLTQIISFTATLQLAIMFWTEMETSIGAVARIRQFESETKDENQTNGTDEPAPDWPSRGGIRIENLTVSYDAGGGRKALDKISLSIEPGQRLAIVGRTGSGKSTLLLSLFRMIEISSGHITIDGIDISTIARHYVRSRLNVIGDDAYFLSGSTRLNVDPYDDATDQQIESVLKKIHLWDVIQSRGGLDADMNEDAFSHGQKQVFCLARALLRPGNIVVMDEVTSAMDRETDALMQSLIREEFKYKTLITIAHRVDTVLDYDRVAVLSDGKLVEFGDPAGLMRAEGGLFRAMCEKKL